MPFAGHTESVLRPVWSGSSYECSDKGRTWGLISDKAPLWRFGQLPLQVTVTQEGTIRQDGHRNGRHLLDSIHQFVDAGEEGALAGAARRDVIGPAVEPRPRFVHHQVQPYPLFPFEALARRSTPLAVDAVVGTRFGQNQVDP